jgi:hypothetical protein
VGGRVERGATQWGATVQFFLKMATAMFAETLKNLQQMTRLIQKAAVIH